MLTPERVREFERNHVYSQTATLVGFARTIEAEVRKECEAEISSLNRRLNECLMCAASESDFADVLRARKEQDEALIRQMKAALSLALSDVEWRAGSPTQKVINKAYNSARARLGEKEGT